jgi:hypothetical protein
MIRPARAALALVWERPRRMIQRLVPDPSCSLGDGAIVKEAFNHDKNAQAMALQPGNIMVSASRRLSPNCRSRSRFDFYEVKARMRFQHPPARQGEQHVAKNAFQGIIPQIERNYRWYRQGSSQTEWRIPAKGHGGL